MLLNNLTVASLSKAKFNICLVKIKLAASETGIGHAYNIRKTAKQKMILAKAVLAAERLGLAQDQLALILSIDSVKTLTSLELDPTSKQGEK